MTSQRLVRAYVGAVALGAVLIIGLLWRASADGLSLALLLFLVLAIMLEHGPSQLRYGGLGSAVFVLFASAAILFGGVGAALLAAATSLISSIVARRSPLKLVFNTAQHSVSIACAWWVYSIAGGSTPATYLLPGHVISDVVVVRDLLLFFLLTSTYLTINSVLVSLVLSLTSGAPFTDVWRSNNRGIVIYDLGSSAIALLVTITYSYFERSLSFGPAGLLLVGVPLLLSRHTYTLYRQLQDNGQELLQLMVKAIEARDPYTSGHSIRVQSLSRAIARELSVGLRELEEIETAALLHDVGKIHEEFAPLLRKEGRLTEEETLLMQTHAQKSADLVGVISKFRGPIQEAVRHHHERWDGKGYPSGLAGGGIPLASRIILVADTIDAMTTDRPYRSRLALEDVVAELQRHKGAQFDPDIVEVAVSSLAVRRLIVDPTEAEATFAVPVQRARRHPMHLSRATSRP